MSKPRPVLSDMPRHIKQKITHSTDFKTRCIVRKCSKHLRNILDQTSLNIEYLNLDVEKKRVIMDVKYWKTDVKESKRIIYKEANSSKNHLKQAVTDFAILVKCPRTVIDRLTIINTEEAFYDWSLRNRGDMPPFIDIFHQLIGNLPYKLNVKKLILKADFDENDQCRILSYCRPENIQFIGLRALFFEQELSRLAATDQWKNARTVDLLKYRSVPHEQLVHFDSVLLENIPFTLGHLRTVLQSFSTSTNRYLEFHRLNLITRDIVSYMKANFQECETNSFPQFKTVSFRVNVGNCNVKVTVREDYVLIFSKL